jgi:hypothetical protein
VGEWRKHGIQQEMHSGGAGTQTAAISFWWRLLVVVTNTALTEKYDGTSWSQSGGNLGTARRRMNVGAQGTQTAGLATGGVASTASRTCIYRRI